MYAHGTECGLIRSPFTAYTEARGNSADKVQSDADKSRVEAAALSRAVSRAVRCRSEHLAIHPVN
jgi:hypothetical protein